MQLGGRIARLGTNGHRVSHGPALLSTDYVVLDRRADFGPFAHRAMPADKFVNSS